VDAAARKKITDVISADRFGTYRQATGGDDGLALRLYEWNIQISAAFLGPLQILEVALRNAAHERMALLRGRSDWWHSPGINLQVEHATRVCEAIVKASRGGVPTPGKVVAELPFGFWVALLGKGGRHRYEHRLWWPALRQAFPHYQGPRKDLHIQVDHLRLFRNRIAHHEPIFARHLAADHASLIEVVGWICPTTCDWMAARSRVDAVLAGNPLHGATGPLTF